MIAFDPRVRLLDFALASEGPSHTWHGGELPEIPVRTRRAGLRFHFTPRHASWLNQIEIWFSILARKLLRRVSFTSQQDLKARIEQFIAYFNKTLAKPFKLTKTGKPPVA